MKRYLILLLLIPILACNGLSTPLPPTPTVVSVTPTLISPTATPAAPSLTEIPSTELSPTNPSPDATTFPELK